MKTLSFILFNLLIIISTTGSSCKKTKQTNCDFDGCDSRRTTIVTANNWSGQLGYFNELRRWAINYHVPNTIDSTLTCIICYDIPDSLKQIGKVVIFSGDIKDGCGSPKPELHGQGIFYINPTKLQ